MLPLIFSTALRAEGLSDTKGMNVKFIVGNCVKRLLPSVSAVIPVLQR